MYAKAHSYSSHFTVQNQGKVFLLTNIFLFFLPVVYLKKNVENMLLNAQEQTNVKSANNFFRQNEFTEKRSSAIILI